LKKLLETILKKLAELTLKRYRPKIVGITGSVGKTSTKEAVYLVLRRNYNVRRNINNYNNEIGVPLTILGEKTAGRSIIGWLIIFVKAIIKLIKTDYPQILVLEMGIDKPQDMDYLLSFIRPDIAIVSAISEIPVHLENFNSVKDLAKEKLNIITGLSKEGVAIINSDSRNIVKYLPEIEQKIIRFALTAKADITASNVLLDSKELMLDDGIRGLSFKLHYEKGSLPVRLPYILAEHQIYAALAAAACGTVFGMNLVEIAEAIKNLTPEKGRLNLIAGIRGTTIIDDTYNASPDSTLAAVKLLKKLSAGGRKIAVLGDMRELGLKTELAHKNVGRAVAEAADIIVTVGRDSLYMAEAAKENGLEDQNAYSFTNISEAGKFIQNNILRPHDLLLVKGSQSMRMEKIVKELMAEPIRAKELLVRQEKRWLKKN
jgi:UDP-N-acetylmuramoyl-tripeptide--D-alanyl-D-alanine ligase